MYKKSRNH